MKMFFANSLPINLRSTVYRLYYNFYEETHFPEEAQIVICGINPVDASIFPRAAFFVCPATNTDHIQNLDSRQIVINIRGAHDLLDSVYSTAEHTMTLICMLSRKVFSKPGFWNRYGFVGTTLRGKTLGIVGYGRVGRQLKKIAHNGFGMHVIHYDTSVQSPYSKEEVLKTSDFISINVSVTPDSALALDASDFALIKKGAFIINTSRGKAIDEEYIIKNHQHFGGIALDVLNGEPNPPNFHKLQKLQNVILTPHISGCTIDDMQRTAEYCLNKLQRMMTNDSTTESQYHC